MRILQVIMLLSAALCSVAADRLNTQPLVLGGELSNSAVTCVADIREVMPRMKAAGLNTVLVPVYWEFLESQQGKYDYTLLDAVVSEARSNGLKVGVLWFGAWKNSMSCYAPLWFKQDTKRYPRAMTRCGKPLEIASCFSENVFRADSAAFTAMLNRLEETDPDMQVVSMIQIENEIGMLEDARDHSKEADRMFAKDVPSALISHLQKNKKHLHKQMADRWQRNGSKTKGTWTQVFGDDIYTDEIFMAWHYGVYVERLAKIARGKSDRMLYVNAAMNSRGRKPGEYPSAGPLAHLKDVWHAAAPTLDLLAPDIYDTGFADWCRQYALPDNRLFIPESRCCVNSGVRALYAFGEHNALGFSPFAIDQAAPQEVASVTEAYKIMEQVSPLYNRYKNIDRWAVLFDKENKERTISDNDAVLTCRHFFTLPWDSRATDGSVWQEGGGIILKLAKDEYLIAGNGIVVEFATANEKDYEKQLSGNGKQAARKLGEDGFVLAEETAEQTADCMPFSGQRMGIGYVDEVEISKEGDIKYLRRHNGDQDHQGRHARISVGEWKILHVKLYRY